MSAIEKVGLVLVLLGLALLIREGWQNTVAFLTFTVGTLLFTNAGWLDRMKR